MKVRPLQDRVLIRRVAEEYCQATITASVTEASKPAVATKIGANA